MTTNVQPPRPVDAPGEPPVVEPTPMPVVTPTNVSGVAVYDRYEDERVDSARPSTVLGKEPVPVETQSTGSIMTWIIAAIVVIVLAYFLLQFIF